VEAELLTDKELDAAVAHNVFGFELKTVTNTKTGKPETLCRKPGSEWTIVTYYSGSMGASLTVEYELSKRGWEWKRCPPPLDRGESPRKG